MSDHPAPCPSPENPCMCRCHLESMQRRDLIPQECPDCAVGKHQPKYPVIEKLKGGKFYGLEYL